MSKRAQAQPIDREAISFEDAFMCGWIWGYGSLESDTLEDMDQQQKRALGVFTRTYRVADAVDAARAADAAQHAAEIADYERQCDCIGADLERADAKIDQLTTVLQWALDVLNATVLGLPLPPLPK